MNTDALAAEACRQFEVASAAFERGDRRSWDVHRLGHIAAATAFRLATGRLTEAEIVLAAEVLEAEQ